MDISGTRCLSFSGSYTCLWAVIGSPILMFTCIPWGWHCHPWQWHVSRQTWLWTWSPRPLWVPSHIHTGPSACGLVMQTQNGLQPPPVVLWASWSQAASFHTPAHLWLRACVPISVTDLSLVCLQAEQLKIWGNCITGKCSFKFHAFTSGFYFSIILEHWERPQDWSDQVLEDLKQAWRFKTKPLSLRKKMDPCSISSLDFYNEWHTPACSRLWIKGDVLISGE